MTEVSVETCFANLRVLSFSLKYFVLLQYHFVTFISGLKLSTLKLPNRLLITDRGINNIQGVNPDLLLNDNTL